MLYAIFLPLLVSWIFKRINSKRIYLTYIISGMMVVFIPLFITVIRMINTFLTMGAPDTAAFAFHFAEMTGGILIMVFITLFFQYIFNKTMGLKRI
ncbi:MAG: hypothetical protein IPP64_16870 [Bacteroidetes bacterium]|nr:hypothetical protein [Bacteroidota bacterium]